MTSPVVAQWPSVMQTPGFAGHSESVAHARQVFAVVLQIGFVAVVQSLFITHATHTPDEAQAGVEALIAAHSVPLPHTRQVFDVVSHTGFAAVVQSVLVPHATQAPDAPQIGVEGSTAAHSVPTAHARHSLVVASQMGFAPVQELAEQAGGTSA
jgi:hypothetical protein